MQNISFASTLFKFQFIELLNEWIIDNGEWIIKVFSSKMISIRPQSGHHHFQFSIFHFPLSIQQRKLLAKLQFVEHALCSRLFPM